jgi:hypothetical protein
MTCAITTLDDTELDAVYGGFTLNIGSFNYTRQSAHNYSSIWGGGGNTVTQNITQLVANGSIVALA